jgi:hypothetical protein
MTRRTRFACPTLLAVFVLTAAAAGQEAKYKLEDVSPVGKPEGFKKGLSSRYAIWWDEGGWHVRTTSGDKGPHAFAGTVEIIGGRMTGLTMVGIEGKGAKKKEADVGTWNPQKTVFRFTLKTGPGHTDGFDFTVSEKAQALKFTLTVGGDEAPAKVFVGAKGEHPKAATFYLPARPGK